MVARSADLWHRSVVAKKKTSTKKRRPTAKQIDRLVMTREEFERTEPLVNSQRRVDWEDAEFVARGFPPSSRPLTDEEVAGMRLLILRDSVGAAGRLLVEVKRLRALVKL